MLPDTLTINGAGWTKVQSGDVESNSPTVYVKDGGSAQYPTELYVRHAKPSGASAGNIRHTVTVRWPMEDVNGPIADYCQVSMAIVVPRNSATTLNDSTAMDAIVSLLGVVNGANIDLSTFATQVRNGVF